MRQAVVVEDERLGVPKELRVQHVAHDGLVVMERIDEDHVDCIACMLQSLRVHQH